MNKQTEKLWEMWMKYNLNWNSSKEDVPKELHYVIGKIVSILTGSDYPSLTKKQQDYLDDAHDRAKDDEATEKEKCS